MWLYQHEAAALTFGARGHADLPAEVHPVVIGELRFPERDRMVLAARSADRAIEGAKFFKAILWARTSAWGEHGFPRRLLEPLPRHPPN